MERPSFLDRANDDSEPKPPSRRPSFLEGSREELRSEPKPPSFLDRANDNSDSEPKRPSFLERFRPDDSLGENTVESERQPFEARDEIDAPAGRAYRDSLPRDNGASSGPDAYGSDRPARTRERSAAPSFERGDPGFSRGTPEERDRRFDLGQSTRSRRDDEPSTQASKDWRSSRFTSRFSQPPKAYDLDEVGDQNIAFEPVEEASPEAPYETGRDAVPRYSEEDLLKKARARSRTRFSRSRTPADDDYAQRPAIPAELPEPEPFEEELAAAPDYAEERRYQADLEDPADEFLQPVEEFDDELLDDGSPPAARRDTEFTDYGSAGEFDQAQRYYDDADAIEDAGPAPSADLPLIDDLAQEPAASSEMRAPRGQSYGDEPQDNYYPETDSVQRGYDDYDTGGRRVEPRAPLSGDELRAERAPAGETGYPQYSETFKDYEEKGSRKPLLLVGALAGVAVVAGGLIFAYQMFAPGGGKDTVPVVKLEEAPSKVAPNDPGGLEVPHQNKLIYDRIVGEETAVAEKVVPREEKVIELDTPAADPSSSQDGSGTSGETAVAVPPPPVSPAIDGGNISDTGREEAVAILQTPGDAVSSAVPEPPDTPIPPPVNEVTVQPAVPEPPQPATPEAPAELRVETVEAPAPVTRIAPPVPLARPEPPRSEAPATEPAASSGSGPIQLAPLPPVTSEPTQPAVTTQAPAVPTTPVQSTDISEPAPAPPAPAPTRVVTAQPTPPPAAPSPAQGAASGDYLIQIAAFRTQPEAEKEYAKLRGKHAGLLQPYGPLIQKADLGSRGIFYRLRVGPMSSRADASALCNSLIAAGEKDCLVRRAR